MYQLKSSPLSEGSQGIFVPGEIEHIVQVERLVNGIPISEEIWCDLKGLSKKYNVSL